MSFPSDENTQTTGTHGTPETNSTSGAPTEAGHETAVPTDEVEDQSEPSSDASVLSHSESNAVSEENASILPDDLKKELEDQPVELTGEAVLDAPSSRYSEANDVPPTPEAGSEEIATPTSQVEASEEDPSLASVSEEETDGIKESEDAHSAASDSTGENDLSIDAVAIKPVLSTDAGSDSNLTGSETETSVEDSSIEQADSTPLEAMDQLTSEADTPAATTAPEESLPETSLNEEVDEQAETEAAKDEDFNSLSRRDLISRLQGLSQQDKISDPLLRKLKAAFDDQLEAEKNAALNVFKNDGGIEEDFEFRKDGEAIEFEQLFRMLREKRKHQLEEVDKTKRINLKQKQQLIEDLKALNDHEESTGSLEEIKRIMDKWRSTGPVPHTDAQELFKNFDFQVDKFYSRRTEFFEMKELDRKKNLERKTALLERAKKTLDEPVFVNGLREYNKIFEEFRLTGPAPREENDRLYTEIKSIGTQLHEKKKTYDEVQRAEAEKIVALRQGLLVQMDVVSGFTSETIAEWQSQTDLVQKLIGEWKAAGSRFRDQEPEVSKRFWAGLKKFYAAKDAFFKKLDRERADNLTKKREILLQVQELVNSDNRRPQSELNAMVAAWKEVGPIAFKDRDKLNKEFSKILDTYYEAKRSTVSAEQTEQRDNLAKKQALIDRLNALAAEKKGDEDELREIQREFSAVGFVPFKKKDEVNAAFKEAFVKAIEQTSDVPQGQKAYIKLEAVRGAGGGGRSNDRSDRGDRGGDRGGRSFGGPSQRSNAPVGPRGILNKKIMGLETDVRNYRNNMDFIASSKNGDKLKAEFNDRILKAEQEINQLRQQLTNMEKTPE